MDTQTPIYDDQKSKAENKAEFDAIIESNYGKKPEDLGDREREEIRQLEEAFNRPSATAETKALGTKADGAVALAEKEDDAADDQVGDGYSGGGKRKGRGSFSKRAKRTWAIVGFIVGLVGLGGSVTFLSLLPSRLETTLNIINDPMSALNQESLNLAVDGVFSAYVKYGAIPALGTTGCKDTIHPGCVKSNAKTPIGLAINALGKSRADDWLAKNGMVIGKRGRDVYYMRVDGNEFDISSLRKGNTDLFSLPDMKSTTKAKLRQEVNAKLKQGTFYDKTFRRLLMNRQLSKQYGARFCTGSDSGWCKPANTYHKIQRSVKDAKLAAKAYALQSMIPEKYNAIFFCLMDVNACNDALDPASKGEDVRRSPAQKKMAEVIQNNVGKIGKLTEADLLKYSNDVAKDGFSKVFMREAAKLIITQLAGEAAGQVASQAVEKAATPVGWIVMAIQAIQIADKAGPALIHLTYALNVASSIELYAQASSIVAQSHNGRMDPAVLGYYNEALATNMAGTADDQHDATQSQLYGAFTGTAAKPVTASSNSILGSLFPTAYAATSDVSTRQGPYTCGDTGKVSPEGQACPQAKPAQGNEILNKIHDMVNTVPGIAPVADAIGPVIGALQGLFGTLLTKACELNPACNLGLQALSSLGSKLAQVGIEKILPAIVNIPITAAMSGARMFEILSVGAAASYAAVTRDLLGGQTVSPATAMQIRQQAEMEQQAEFNNQPLYARIFSKDSPRSVVSQIAMSLPAGELDTAQSGIASLTHNPLQTIASTFGTIFAGRKSYAAPAISTQIAVGVPDTMVMNVPSDFSKAWDQYNCSARYDPATNTLDSSAWLNDPNNVTLDPVTGDMDVHHTDVCRTIMAGSQALAYAFDPAMINDGTSATAPTNNLSTVDQTTMYQDSSGVVCDTRTTDKGVADGYYNGTLVKVHLCGIPTISGAVVNARVSTNYYELGALAKNDGINLAATSSFRTMAEQQAICASRGGCDGVSAAKPGYSNHQMGLAIDFTGPTTTNYAAQSCSDRARDPTDRTWAWLENNAAQFGIKQYMAESWHWDTIATNSRCGGDGT